MENLDLGKACLDNLELDMRQAAAQFPEAEYLNLNGSPGIVTHMQEAGKLSELRNFYCKNLFGYDAGDMEALERLHELRELDFDSVPKEAGLYLKKHWKRKRDREEIEEIVRRYTRYFNKLNDRYEEFIEIEEGEDIFMAMQRLYEECILQGEWGQADENAAPVTLSEIWDVMDEVRENW